MRRRKKFRVIANQIAEEVMQKPYDYWVMQQFEITCERTYEDMEVQVEIVMLESEKDYIKLGISVDDGRWFNPNFPVTKGVIIKRELA